MTTDSPLQKKIDRARALIANKHVEQARAINAELLVEAPEHPRVLLQASRLEGLAGRYRSARRYALEAFKHRPRDERELLTLLNRLQTFHLTDELHTLVDEFFADGITMLPLLNETAKTLNQLNQPERALALLDRGLAIHPLAPDLLLSRAQTRMFLGKFDLAELDLLACLKTLPQKGFAWWLLAKLRRQTAARNHVETLEGFLRRSVRFDPTNTVFLAYALHKELDDLGDYAGAAKALDLACRTRRAQLSYSSEETRQIFSLLASAPIATPVAASAPDRVPVFIVGMHRSGTTLLEQLLDGHPDIRGLGELYDFTSQMRLATDYACKGVMDLELARRMADVDLPAVGAGYLESVRWRLGEERYFTDKLPSNFLNIGSICQALPQAKILHMVRDPMETGLSNLRECFADTTNQYSYDQTELGEYHLEYQRLMAHWHRTFPGRILDVNYARLTSDTEAVLRGIVSFLGLPFAPEMLDLQANARAITTASAVQVRGEVQGRDQPKWAPYADYLAPLAKALAGG